MELLIPALIVVWFLLAALMFGLRVIPSASDRRQSANPSPTGATEGPSSQALGASSGEHAQPDAW